MNTEIIKLEIEGKEFECEVEFNFTPGREAVLFSLPENCSPAEPEEWEISVLKIWVTKDVYGDLESFQLVDASFLIEDLGEVIIEKLEALRDEG
jgi:hypothetical protein